MNSKAGYVAVIGRPNVGKSTLINRIVKQKIAITSRKPQTTRHTLLAIHTVAPHQIVFVDTPGMHRERKKAINRHMQRVAQQSIHAVDSVLWLLEAGNYCAEDDDIFKLIQEINKPIIVALNKIDRQCHKEKLLAQMARCNQLKAAACVPIAAINGSNLDVLQQKIIESLPYQAPIFPADQITTANMRFMAAEVVREKLFRYIHQEVPYQLAVIIDSYREDEKIVTIAATIYVERSGQKAIVIGKNGSQLKIIGKNARLEIEKMIAKKVMLRLWVKVRDNWGDNEKLIKSMGYTDYS